MNKQLKAELLKLQNEYIVKKANYEIIKAIEESCKTKVLNENIFYTEAKENRKHERIISHKSDFRMSDEDFTKYCKLVYKEYLKNSLEVPDYNTTADYKAFPELIKAEENLLKIGIEIMINAKGNECKKDLEKAANHWKYRNDMIDLILKLEA